MLEVQKRLPKCRIFRFDSGEAYAPFSVKKAIEVAIKHGIAAAMRELVRIKYGVDGFPDLVFLNNSKMLGVEVKIGKDKQRASQISMESVFKSTGHEYTVIDDKESLETQVEKIVCLLM